MLRLALVLSLLSGAVLAADPPAVRSELSPLQFLVGEWVAEPSPGSGTGHCAFTPDLSGKVLLRTNHAEVPAAEGRPASVHDDLMVVYLDGAPPLKAIYFDNEGHVIHYVVTVPAAGKAAFVSDPVKGAPRFRLSYATRPDGRLDGVFEIAPPDKPEAFGTYLRWVMRRKG